MKIRSTKGVWSTLSLLGAIFGTLAYWPNLTRADTKVVQPVERLAPIVVTAKRRPVMVADDVLKEQVETALHDDPYFPDMHVDVTVRNGVAYMEGVVYDYSDEVDAKRIAKRIAGVKRVVTDFYFCCGGD